MQLKKALLLMLLCAMLLTAASVAFAQEAPAAEPATTEAPAGLGTLMLLIGLGAVVLVGGVMVARENFKAGDDTD